MLKAKVIVCANTSWNIVNYRPGLIRALIDAGYNVQVVAPTDGYSDRVRELGCSHVALAMESQGTSPLGDLFLLARFWVLLRRERPHVFLGYTIKPNVYGSLVAHSLGIPVLNNVSGLGYTFIKQSWLTRLVKHLYWISFRRSRIVFFQNRDDMELFVTEKLVKPEIARLLPGSGVDISRFLPASKAPDETGEFSFLLAGRLLWDKGISEFVEAARLVRREEPKAKCCLLGFLEVQNPSAIPRAVVQNWVNEGVVEYLGSADDIVPFLAASDCVVLPSYREGAPRTLLEAAAMAKPLIATDVPGCREVLEHSVNGFLCPARDATALATRMLEMIRLPSEARMAMGAASRAKIEQEFDQRIVNERYLQEIQAILEEGAIRTFDPHGMS